jgi:hypothetical protein
MKKLSILLVLVAILFAGVAVMADDASDIANAQASGKLVTTSVAGTFDFAQDYDQILVRVPNRSLNIKAQVSGSGAVFTVVGRCRLVTNNGTALQMHNPKLNATNQLGVYAFLNPPGVLNVLGNTNANYWVVPSTVYGPVEALPYKLQPISGLGRGCVTNRASTNTLLLKIRNAYTTNAKYGVVLTIW